MNDARPEYRLHHLTSPEFQDLLSTARVGLIPLGATEQHGPHLAMGTDAMVAEQLAERVARAAAGLAVMTPPLPVGFSPHHLSFPGTISARPETLTSLLYDVVNSLRGAGLRRFLIINGHGGNLAFLPAWMATCERELGIRLALAHWSLLGRDVVADTAQSEMIGHACEVETSLVLALAPNLVRRDRLEPAPVKPAPHPLVKGHAIPERAVGVFLPRSFESITANGALGNPTVANLEAGQRLADVVVDRAAEFLTWFADAEVDGSPASTQSP